MTRFLVSAAALLASLLLAAACGGGDDDDASPEGDASATASPGATDDSGNGSEDTADLSGVSFADNLLAKEADGEWTRGEGLIATLRYFAGESSEEDVLRSPELERREGTGIIAMAREYVEDGPDAGAKAEIERLLDLLTFTNDELEAMAGISAVGGLLDRLRPGASQEAEQSCKDFFNNYVEPPGTSPCLEAGSRTIAGKLYRVFYPSPLPAAGWSEEHVEMVLDAVEVTAAAYGPLGTLPAANIVFSVSPTPGGAMATPEAGKPCGVVLFANMATSPEPIVKFYLAHELAHCFQTETFPGQNSVDYQFAKWREEGLADYMANVVYPDVNREWGKEPEFRSQLTGLAIYELNTTIFDRAYTNFIFFQYLANIIGDTGIMGLVASLPVSGGAGDQIAALANYPGMDELYHDFSRAMTDGTVIDASGVVIPYEAPFKAYEIASAASPLLQAPVKPFGIARYRLYVSGTKQAMLDYEPKGLVRESARPPDEADWAQVPTVLPFRDCIPEAIVLITNTEPDGAFTFNVPEVKNVEGGGTLTGEWVLQNSSIKEKIEYLAPAQSVNYGGTVRATFRDDGTMKADYEEFTVSGSSSVDITQGAFHQQVESTYHSVTNASGVDGYEVTNDFIFFDSLSESDFLKGTNTVTSTKKGIFLEVEEADTLIPIDEENTRVDTENLGWAIFGAGTQFDLQCNGTVLRFLSADEPYASFNRVGPAE